MLLCDRGTSELDPSGLDKVGRTLAKRLWGDGGVVARDALNQAAEKCAEPNLSVSGHSPGGMVSHNVVAHANNEAKKRVAASLHAIEDFGHSSQGAKIKGHSGPIMSYCNPDGLACTKNFIVTKAHMSYAGAGTDRAARDVKPSFGRR
ncbi:hypothetical protein FKW77_009954 [Venturia effusa]|uniref:cutinase n=1 Tax=Venturia effusa TaxID=50376 RepID=A0A517L266_9PEZI|nr:hypothetical protein FKW77_009954 [Venturia effusa]